MVGVNETFQDFLLNQPAQINLPYFAVSIILAAILGYLLSHLYTIYGTSISNRKKFSSNFIILISTTTLIITVVKSSLALSLGLVGALSIVRFRAAIKEPEELGFLFLCIALGLGLGAGQFGVTLIGFVLISIFIAGRHFYIKKEKHHNLHLIISGKSGEKLNLTEIAKILKKHSKGVELNRFEESKENELEAGFSVILETFEHLTRIKNELKSLSPSVSITYLNKSDIVG